MGEEGRDLRQDATGEVEVADTPPLLADGQVVATRRGRYRARGAQPVMSESAKRVLTVVRELGGDAHLTGFDLLAPYAHQFFAEYPHLVYAEPASLETASFRLAQAGFVVVIAAHGAQPTVTASPSQTVVLRAQRNAEQYGVHGLTAHPEKAWVDTLREVHRGHLPFDLLELGRILRTLLDQGGDLRKLRNYARRMGYLARIDAMAAERSVADYLDEDARVLHAGFWS